ncbi:MAG: flagellar biosynthesis anti-sigma factor FlgM [Desulfamplus sp.]|nr:flagellar biosynthesis anti-sigma factor FlgM [Desulfamplus sp.]MBF0257618.1 flagellar biosynthesis anti-sigma factor FlgM [Desulfamplus sp.]
MKIQHPNTIFVPKAYTQAESSKTAHLNPAEHTVKTGKSDSVTLSSTTLQLQKISAAMDVPQENRSERISALKDSITRGEYAIHPEKIAEKVLNSFYI